MSDWKQIAEELEEADRALSEAFDFASFASALAQRGEVVKKIAAALPCAAEMAPYLRQAQKVGAEAAQRLRQLRSEGSEELAASTRLCARLRALLPPRSPLVDCRG